MQISSLRKQNRILVNQSQQTSKNQVNSSHNVKEDTEILTSTVATRNGKSASVSAFLLNYDIKTNFHSC